MLKGPAIFLALLALALAALFAVPAIATATPIHIHPCTSASPSYGPPVEYNKFKCPSASPSTSTSTSPSKPVSPSASLATTPSAAPTATPGALPVTGAKTDWLIGSGVVVLLLGVGGVIVGRRRRNGVRFEA